MYGVPGLAYHPVHLASFKTFNSSNIMYNTLPTYYITRRMFNIIGEQEHTNICDHSHQKAV